MSVFLENSIIFFCISSGFGIFLLGIKVFFNKEKKQAQPGYKKNIIKIEEKSLLSRAEELRTERFAPSFKPRPIFKEGNK